MGPRRQRSIARSARLSLATALLGATAACEPPGELTLLLSGTAPGDSLEALFVPVDPMPLLAGDSISLTEAERDSLVYLAELGDSARMVDTRFRELRDELNTEAAALAGMDRRSNQYAERFDDFHPRSLRAEALRLRRDRYRQRATELRSRLSHVLPDSARIQAGAIAARGRVDAARDEIRQTFSVTVRAPELAIRLQPGSWWVGIAGHGMLPRIFVPVDIRSAVRDTLTLSLSAG